MPFNPGGSGASDVTATMPIFRPTFSLPAPASIGAPNGNAIRARMPEFQQVEEGGIPIDPVVLAQKARRSHQIAKVTQGQMAGLLNAAGTGVFAGLTVVPMARMAFAPVAVFAVDETGAQLANSWRLGGFKSAAKWANQMAKRGWTEAEISEAIASGEPYPATNLVNKANTATRYVHPTTGRSVVLDDATKEVLQVGGNGFVW